MTAQGPYKLDLDTNKKNVFVTQLNEREDEDDATVYPVVQESGDKLIQTGINTLQRTLLLKKEVEVESVQTELEAKRHEFKQRMEACAQRQVEVQKRQQRMKDRTAKFEKFIKENEAKRKRAIQKYQAEVKLKEQKQDEFDILCEQMEELEQRQKYLENKVVQHRKYEEYLLRVTDAMPEDYLASADDKVKGLMMRHRTLSDSNKSIVDNLVAMTDELEDLKLEIDSLMSEHNKEKISINSEIANFQKQQERLQEQNKQMEQAFIANKGDLLAKRRDLGITFMAIDNIAEMCRKEWDPTLEKMSLELKLTRIRDHLNDREDVAKMAQPSEFGDAGRTGSSNLYKGSRVRMK
ncbi:hypothetical protein ScPMuIL_014184 [Solemya velum]